MKVTFYKYHKGSYVQREKVDKVENMTTQDLMKIADLRHPVLTKKEYYDVQSTDIKGKPKNEFSLMSSTHYLVVKIK